MSSKKILTAVEFIRSSISLLQDRCDEIEKELGVYGKAPRKGKYSKSIAKVLAKRESVIQARINIKKGALTRSNS